MGRITEILGGWYGALMLLAFYIVSVVGAVKMQGDDGALLFVALYFIVNPMLAVLVIVLALLRVPKYDQPSQKLIHVISCIIPATILYITATGSSFVIDLLGLGSN